MFFFCHVIVPNIALWYRRYPTFSQLWHFPHCLFCYDNNDGSAWFVNIIIWYNYRRFYVEPFVDMHKVEGLRSIYIASQFITNKTSDLQLADTNQTTRITYDKGGLWTHIRAPYITGQGSFTHCYWVRSKAACSTIASSSICFDDKKLMLCSCHH